MVRVEGSAWLASSYSSARLRFSVLAWLRVETILLLEWLKREILITKDRPWIVCVWICEC